MKDLRKKLLSLTRSRQAERSLPSGAGNRSVSRQASSGDVSEFLNKVAAMPAKHPQGQGRLVFALDATASREATWDIAMQLQADMFSEVSATGGLEVQLVYFKGLAGFRASEWLSDSAQLLQQMTGIRCEAGTTRILRVLEHVKRESREDKIHAVVFIGDSMEESHDVLCQLAGELGMLNIPLFMFQEGADPVARRCFMEMARLSNGAYAPFDHSSAGQLRDLLRAVAVYASGGYQALRDFSRAAHPVVQTLSRQLPAPKASRR